MKFSDSSIQKVVDSVFIDPTVIVVEAYSEYDKEPIIFISPDQLFSYISSKLMNPRGLAFFFVVYPDMLGTPIKETIRAKSKSMSNEKIRYTWQGWGLISVQLSSPDLGLASCVKANTEKRALQWASTKTTIPPPTLWDWRAVSFHTNRLKRILKSVA